MPIPLLSVGSDPQLPVATDVVVIGGGISGVATAYDLARRGLRVALLEKGQIGAEQSGRNWGWIRQQNRDLRELPLAMLSHRLWPELAEATRTQLGEDLSYRRTGLVYASDKPEDIARWSEWGEKARAQGLDTRMLSPAELAPLLPGNARSWLGGVHSPSDARAEPAVVTPLLALLARKAGVSLHQSCAAREIEFSAGRVSGVITEAGRISCGAVVVAGGAWSAMLLRHHGIKMVLAAIQSTAFATLPATGAGEQITEGGISLPDVTLRRRLDGGYTVGLTGQGMVHLAPWGMLQARPFWGTFMDQKRALSWRIGASFYNGPDALRRWSADGISPFERMRVLDPAPTQKFIRKGLASLARAYPALAGLKIAQSWGGLIDFTPDALPVISAVDGRAGLFINAGHSGHGFGVGPAAGRLMAELVSGDAPSVDPAPFRHARMLDGSDLGKIGKM